MTRTEFVSPHQDTVSGREEEQNTKQEDESQYVTIQRAAQLCGVSSKTIQRAIQAGTLPARYPKPNRCEIAVSDLERIQPGHVSGHNPEPLEQRVAVLEQRVQELEDLVEKLRSKLTASKPPSRTKARERTTGPLPKQFVWLLAFARHHNVAESKALTHVDMRLLPVKRGEWTDVDGTTVTLALDATGRIAFYKLSHGVPPFVECRQCPHHTL